jgi:hypothetical protein
MPKSRSFNKKQRRKKLRRVATTFSAVSSTNRSSSSFGKTPITVEVNGEEIIVDAELISAMGGILRGDEVEIASGLVKMSEVIMKFVEPFLGLADESYRRAFLSLAVTCWNGALLPAEARAEVPVRKFEQAPWWGELMEALIARKQAAFADNNWMVNEYEIAGSGAQAQLKISSTVLMPHLVNK